MKQNKSRNRETKHNKERKMKLIKLGLQGFIIGIGKIIPGVSGAMFAMMFGVYEKV